MKQFYQKSLRLRSNMHELTKEEIKQKQLNILDAFVKVCEENGLRYYLCGGSLLGAVRHKGYIPWDDDIDVFMPRPDYEKIQGLDLPKPYEIQYYKNKKNNRPFLKMVDSSIEAAEKNNKSKADLWMDVFAIDSLFECNFLNKWHYKITKFLRKGVYFGFRPRTGVFGKVALSVLKVFGISPASVNRLFSAIIENICKIRPYEKGRFVGGINWGYGPHERMERADLESAVPVEFEGKMYNAPVGYDKYLHNLYGDYMQLPPVEKRICHGLQAWEKD